MKSQFCNPEFRLFVETVEQKVLFFGELLGQFSDGYWENARPNDHYKPWCQVDWDNIIVTGDPSHIGRNFYAPKTHYNLSSPDLLEAVGDRMLFLVKLARVLPDVVLTVIAEDHWQLPESAEEYREKLDSYRAGTLNDYYTDKVLLWFSLGLTEEVIEAAEADPYTMKDLRKDLRGLREAMQVMQPDEVITTRIDALKCRFAK